MKKYFAHHFLSSLLLALPISLILAWPSHSQALVLNCQSLFDSVDLPTLAQSEPRSHTPPSELQIRSQLIAATTPKLGAYSRITIGLNEGNLNIVSDASAGWLKSSVETKIKKPIEQINQSDVKNYLSLIAKENLADLITPRLHAYRGVDRPILRDSETYYLEELMLDKKRKDLSLALIGQLLFETYAKKDSRLVQISYERKPKFALLLNGKSPEVILPGICEGIACGEAFSKISLTVTTKPPPVSKDQKQIFLYDLQGRTQILNIVGRSPLERMIKADEEQLLNASPEDLIPVESYFITQHRPAGSTAFRIGETIYHFGGDGWGLYKGTEKVKGFLVSNPYLRNNAKTFASLKVPPFNVGVIMLVPKKHIDLFIASVAAEMEKHDDEKIKFDYYKSNCNHVPLCHFRDAGMPMGSPIGISGFSTSFTSRNIFLNPPYAVRSKNIYPLAGTELTEGQIRDLFPPLLYRYHTLKHDGHLLNLSESDQMRWQTAHLLNIIQKNPGASLDELFQFLQNLNLEIERNHFENLVEAIEKDDLISFRQRPVITIKGEDVLKEREMDYILNE